MPVPNYTFSEFIDRLLVRLYEKDREEGSPVRFFDLLEISRELKDPPPEKWALDAANVLRTRGWAEILINSMIVGARITGSGRLYVEEGKGTTKQIRRAPNKYYVKIHVNTHGGDAIVSGHGSVTQTKYAAPDEGLAFKLLREMKDKVENDSELRDTEKSDAIQDIDTIEREVRRPDPDQTILASFLHRLRNITSIASEIATLIQLING